MAFELPETSENTEVAESYSNPTLADQYSVLGSDFNRSRISKSISIEMYSLNIEVNSEIRQQSDKVKVLSNSGVHTLEFTSFND